MSSYLFLNKPTTLAIFWGGGDSDLLTPHRSMDSEIKRIGRNDRYSLIYDCSIAADITNGVHVLLWTNFKYITKGNNF